MEMWDKLKAKGREVLILLTAVAVLLSAVTGIIGDAVLMLLIGAIGWFLSDDKETEKK